MRPFLTDDALALRLRLIEREARNRGFVKWAEELGRVAEVFEQEVRACTYNLGCKEATR